VHREKNGESGKKTSGRVEAGFSRARLRNQVLLETQVMGTLSPKWTSFRGGRKSVKGDNHWGRKNLPNEQIPGWQKADGGAEAQDPKAKNERKKQVTGKQGLRPHGWTKVPQ